MANRKKSDTLHFRTAPVTKLSLDCLANCTNTSMTSVLERLLVTAVEEINIDVISVLVNEAALTDGKLMLKTAIDIAYKGCNPITTKLRLYYIARIALSSRDKIIMDTIVELGEFAGESDVFSTNDKLINRKYSADLPKFNLNEIARQMPSLEEFASTLEKNPNLKFTYDAFLKMSS